MKWPASTAPHSRSLPLSVDLLLAIAGVMGMLATLLFAASAARAQETDASSVTCETTAFIEQAGEVLIDLPSQAGSRFTLDPKQNITVRTLNSPASGSLSVKVQQPFGGSNVIDYTFTTEGEGTEHIVEMTPADIGLEGDVSGVYKVDVTLNAPGRTPCLLNFEVRLGGELISGTLPAVTAGAAAITAAAAVAASAWAAAGTTAASTLATGSASTASAAASAGSTAATGTATSGSTAAAGASSLADRASDLVSFEGETSLEIEIQRRRKTGWRRWVPVPNWKRSIIGTTIGTVTGVLGSIFLQQGGIQAFTVPSVIRDAFIGAAGSFSFTLVIGSVVQWLRKPVSEVEEKEELEVEGAQSTIEQR